MKNFVMEHTRICVFKFHNEAIQNFFNAKSFSNYSTW